MSSHAAQTVKWNNLPIPVQLETNQEMIIQVMENVEIGLPESLLKKVKAESQQGYVYITSIEDFDKTRIKLRLLESGQMLLIDLSSTPESTEQENIFIQVGDVVPEKKSDYVNNNSYRSRVSGSVTPIQLTRYAARSFFGPERLVIKDDRIRMGKVGNLDLSDLFTGPSRGLFLIEPLAVFKTGKMHLTAIKLTNKTTVPQVINSNHINAKFSFSTPQSTVVNQKNVAGDMTVLYLITDVPIASSMYASSKRLVTRIKEVTK